MDNKQAIKEIEELMKDDDYTNVWSGASSEPMNIALELAITELEKQAFFENEVSNIRDWFVDNKDCLLDDVIKVAKDGFIESSVDGFIDEVDLDFIVEGIVDKIQEGILNVLDSYKTN